MTLVVRLSKVAERQSMHKRHVEQTVNEKLGLVFSQQKTRRQLFLALHRIRAGTPVASAARAVC